MSATTTTTTEQLTELCMGRIGPLVTAVEAAAIVERDYDVATTVVERLEATWKAECSNGCAEANASGLACQHLRRLWDARSYRDLATAHRHHPIPAGTKAYPCDCSGTGVFHGAGYVENGVFKGHTGDCFRCAGKGWQTAADVRRNRYYDNHVRRVSL